MYVRESLILREIKADNQEDVLRLMAGHLFEQGYVKESFSEAVIEREKTYATGLPTVGFSVAIPHTDIEHVLKKAVCIGILEDPVSFGIMGEHDAFTSVKIVFMLAMNQKDSQLDILQRLMMLFQDDSLMKQLASETKGSKIADILLEKLIVEKGKIQ